MIYYYILICIFESIFGILSYPFNFLFRTPYHEVPEIYYIKTKANDEIISKLPISKYKCPPWLVGPFIQTLVYYSIRSNNPTSFRREFIQMTDGVDVAIDIKDYKLSDTAPIVFICHGIGGGSDEPLIAKVSDICLEKGWRCIVYIRRGHQGTSLLPKTNSNLKPKIFPVHCDMEDMSAVVHHVNTKYPNSKKIIAGFSAGSNIAVKYLATAEFEKYKIVAGISLCNGHNLNDLTNELEEKRPILNHLMTKNLKNVFRNRFHEIKHLCHIHHIDLNIKAALQAKTARNFEFELLPIYGYDKTEEELERYYLDNSCCHVIHDVKVPLLSIENRGDPCIARHLSNYVRNAAIQNENIISIITERGGHLGWMEGWRQSWSVKIIISYIETVFTRAIVPMDDIR